MNPKDFKPTTKIFDVAADVIEKLEKAGCTHYEAELIAAVIEESKAVLCRTLAASSEYRRIDTCMN